MTSRDEARNELARFLRDRRRQADPVIVGLRTGGRRRTPGLRREEVALLSGVSITWYTWLEQGRDISPSVQVITAVARTLRLSDVERQYVLRLAGHHFERPEHAPGDELPGHVKRFMAALGGSPAFAMTSSWSIVGWNAAYEAFYPGITTVAPRVRNLLWLVFTDHALRSLLANWDVDSRRFLAQFRAEAGPLVHQPPVAGLVSRLEQASEEFRDGWADHDVEQFTSRERRFTHPVVGHLVLEHHRLSVSDCPGVDLVVYTAVPGTGSEARLARLR